MIRRKPMSRAQDLNFESLLLPHLPRPPSCWWVIATSLREKINSTNWQRTGVLHPTKEGQFPRDPIFFGQTPVFLEGPWSGDSETVGEIEKGVRFFLREPFSQWKQATRRKSPQWPNVAGIKFVIVVPMCMLVPHEKWVKNLSWQQFSIFGAFSSSHWEKRDFIKTQAMYFVLLW